jgi:hypothetical protein
MSKLYYYKIFCFVFVRNLIVNSVDSVLRVVFCTTMYGL